MATTTEVNTLDSTGLINKYAEISKSTMRDLYAMFPTDHIYQIFENTEAEMGYTPFPPSQCQSWGNLRSKEPKTMCAEKVEVQKTKPDPANKKKKIKLEGTELKEKRLRKAITFNAQGKAALAFIITSIVHEAVSAGTMSKSDIDSIKNAICDASQNECEYSVSPLIFAIVNNVDESIIKEQFKSIHGGLISKLEAAIDKYITTDTNVRNVISTTFSSFLKIFTIHLASNSWFETKEIENAETKETEDTGVGKTISDKQIRQFLMINNNLLLKGDDRVQGELFNAMDEYYAAIVKADEIKKAENKKKKAESLAKKAADKAEKEAAAKDATGDEPEADADADEPDADAEEGDADADAEEAPVEPVKPAVKPRSRTAKKPTEVKEEAKAEPAAPAAAVEAETAAPAAAKRSRAKKTTEAKEEAKAEPAAPAAEPVEAPEIITTSTAARRRRAGAK